MKRCNWCLDTFEQYIQYHDEEWGVPVYDDRTHFEFLVLESAQAGLSWRTILKKREGYRNAFADFNVEQVAGYGEDKVQQLLHNPEIVRNEMKIRAAVNNAQRFIEIQNEYGTYSDYIWTFVGEVPIQNEWEDIKQIPANTELSDSVSKDLKRRGFKFLGSTTVYAYLQATGLVNDHLVSCFRYQELKNNT